MKTNDIEMRHPRGEFVPSRKKGKMNWFKPRYERRKTLPEFQQSVIVNVEKFIGRIVL